MNLTTRATNIITRPSSEWVVIAAEPADVTSIFVNYVLILAAIPAVCLFIGMGVIAGFVAGGLGIVAALTGAVLHYVTAVVGVFVAALVIQQLAPTFGSRGDTAQALKLVAYSYTPIWVAGVLYLVIFLSPLAIIAVLFAIYLFYIGLPVVMKTPADKVIPYMLVSALVIIVVQLVLRLILGVMWVAPLGYNRMF
jgi:hypothetical protein